MANSDFPGSFIPRPKTTRPAKSSTRSLLERSAPIVFSTFVLVVGFFSLPQLLALDIKLEDNLAQRKQQTLFPVSVDPANKTITYNAAAEAFLSKDQTKLDAAVGDATNVIAWLASFISNLPAYQSLAASNMHIVTIEPGYREEEVASTFGRALGWSAAQQKQFLTKAHATAPKLTEGEFEPGTYVVYGGETTSDVQFLINQRFQDDIQSRYSTTTQEKVPLKDALTIASLLEREAGGWDDMREISGIMWNRLFNNMNLQIDATLQYAKADTSTTKLATWWPTPKPADKYIKSPYNTYQHAGLPPGPIANPSVAAVLAALNPVATDCLFYFHDRYGNFHCSPTYAGHVALLKKYYGQGK